MAKSASPSRKPSTSKTTKSKTPRSRTPTAETPTGETDAPVTPELPAAADPAPVDAAPSPEAAAAPPAAGEGAARPAAKRAPRSASRSTSRSAAKPAAKPVRAASRDTTKPAAKPAAQDTPPPSPSPRPTSNPAAATKRSSQQQVDRVWELADKIGICMLVTWDGERQRARPLAATVERQRRAIWFLTDADSHKDEQIARFPLVTLTFADHGASNYVAITGSAEVLNDRAQIRKLWSPFAKAWWDSPEDPSIRAIKVTPEDAELWDGPGGLLARVGMLAAAVTGRRPKIGENAKVTL